MLITAMKWNCEQLREAGQPAQRRGVPADGSGLWKPGGRRRCFDRGAVEGLPASRLVAGLGGLPVLAGTDCPARLLAAQGTGSTDAVAATLGTGGRRAGDLRPRAVGGDETGCPADEADAGRGHPEIARRLSLCLTVARHRGTARRQGGTEVGDFPRLDEDTAAPGSRTGAPTSGCGSDKPEEKWRDTVVDWFVVFV